MSDKNARSILLSEDALGGSYIIFKGCLWFLDNADVIPILDKDVVGRVTSGNRRRPQKVEERRMNQWRTAIAWISKWPPRSNDATPINSRAGNSLVVK